VETSAAIQSIPLLVGMCVLALAAAYLGTWVFPEKLGQPPANESRKRFTLFYMGFIAVAIVVYVVLALTRVI